MCVFGAPLRPFACLYGLQRIQDDDLRHLADCTGHGVHEGLRQQQPGRHTSGQKAVPAGIMACAASASAQAGSNACRASTARNTSAQSLRHEPVCKPSNPHTWLLAQTLTQLQAPEAPGATCTGHRLLRQTHCHAPTHLHAPAGRGWPLAAWLCLLNACTAPATATPPAATAVATVARGRWALSPLNKWDMLDPAWGPPVRSYELQRGVCGCPSPARKQLRGGGPTASSKAEAQGVQQPITPQ